MPEQPDIQKRMAVILFIDIMDSSEMSNVLSFEDYDRLITRFQEVATDVLRENVMKDAAFGDGKSRRFEASVRGDEMCVILYWEDQERDESLCKQDDIHTVLRLAIQMKRKWLCSGFNASRVKDGKSIVDIGTGINCGYLIVGEHRRVAGLRVEPMRTAEGYAINLAKRIEGHSRNGTYSRIFVSRSVYNALRIKFQIAFSQVQMAVLKGIAQPVPVYEIKSFGHVEDTAFTPHFEASEAGVYESAVQHNPHELWLILDLAHHYFDIEDYSKAVETYKLALEVDPEFAPAHMYLGRSYYRDFHDKQALPHLEQALQKNPDSARANNFLGVCLRRLAFRERYDGSAGVSASAKWKEYYQKAIEAHKVAMHRSEQEPQRYSYIWAFNSYAMTYAQAVHEKALWDHEPSLGEERQALGEAERAIDEVLSTNPEGQMNLFYHVKGFICATRGSIEEARGAFATAAKFLREDTHVKPKKYREKMAEIYFHRGFLNCGGDWPSNYRRALCEAYVGDILKHSTKSLRAAS